MSVQLVSHHAEETERIGERLGRHLSHGDIVCLYGELGAGKTTLTKGLATGLGVPAGTRVRSPSFVLIHHYRGRLPVYHADLYRLSDVMEVADIGLHELLGGAGVTIIEWAEKLEPSLPSERLDVSLIYHGDEARVIIVRPHGEHYRGLVEGWWHAQAIGLTADCPGSDEG